jgi:hypothetical protein
MAHSIRALLVLFTTLSLSACSIKATDTSEVQPAPPPEKTTVGPVALKVSETGKPQANELLVVNPIQDTGYVDYVFTTQNDMAVKIYFTDLQSTGCGPSAVKFSYVLAETDTQGHPMSILPLAEQERFRLAKGKSYAIYVTLKNVLSCSRIAFHFVVEKVDPASIPVTQLPASGAQDAKRVRCEDGTFIIEADFSKSDLVNAVTKDVSVSQKRAQESIAQVYKPQYVPVVKNGTATSFYLYDIGYNDELTIKTYDFIEGTAVYRPKNGSTNYLQCHWYK